MSPVNFEIIPRPPASLLTIPIEILQYIAIILVNSSPLGPPEAIVPFLSTCRHIYHVVHTPQVFGAIFHLQFDTAALYRRFPQGAINNTALTTELKRRWRCLSRIRTASLTSELWHDQKRGVYSQAMLQEDLMTAYLMFLESDGRNAVQLLRWAHLPDYLEQYKNHICKYTYSDPVMPSQSEESVLYIWLNWFCLDYRNSLGDVGSLVSYSTAYVFGTFAYEGFHAPWPYHHLPAPSLPPLPSTMPQAGQQATRTPSDGIFTVDNSLAPRQLSKSMSHYFGQPFEMALPLVSQAATLLYVTAITQYPLYDPEVPEPTVKDLINAIPTGFTSASSILLDNQATCYLQSYTPSYMQTRFATITDSRAYDDEFKRGVACHDPRQPRLMKELGMPRYQFTRGSLTGEWDGRLLISTLQAYRAIMEGEAAINVLEDAVVLHDVQSWRIEEHYYSKQLTSYLPSSTGTPAQPPAPGSPLNAHLPYRPCDLQPVSTWYSGRQIKGLVATTPSSNQIFYQTWDSAFEDEDDDDNDTIDVVITGRAIDRPAEIPDTVNCSMQPGSIMYGTIRKWDGLVTLRTTSQHPIWASESWLWRGYVIGNGPNTNFVGRYREAHADIDHFAYEGSFTMVKKI